MSAFLLSMVLNILKFTIQKEKKRIFIFKYCKIDVKSAATLIFAATLITAPTVRLVLIKWYNVTSQKLNDLTFVKALTLNALPSGSLQTIHILIWRGSINFFL